MSNPNPRKEFLKPLNTRTKIVQRKIQALGGKKSAENKRKTKELIKISLYLHEFIDSQEPNVRQSLKNIVSNGGQTLINLIKEVRESTEGNKNILMNPDYTALKNEGIKIVFVKADPKKQIDDSRNQTSPSPCIQDH